MLAGIALYGEFMTVDEWKKKMKFRGYAHFDRKITINEAWDYISDPLKIKTHGFLPFIHHTLKITKYSKSKGKSTKTVKFVIPHTWIGISISTTLIN